MNVCHYILYLFWSFVWNPPAFCSVALLKFVLQAFCTDWILFAIFSLVEAAQVIDSLEPSITTKMHPKRYQQEPKSLAAGQKGSLHLMPYCHHWLWNDSEGQWCHPFICFSDRGCQQQWCLQNFCIFYMRSSVKSNHTYKANSHDTKDARAPNGAQFAHLWHTRPEIHPIQVLSCAWSWPS